MASTEIEIPENIEITINENKITVKGENGETHRELKSSKINIEKKENKILLESATDRKKDRAELGTFTSHINNMIKGAQKDFEYTLKVVYSHFPIKMEVKQNKLYIKNFLGEKNPRIIELIGENTDVEISDDEVIVRGPNKEAVSQTAAKIQEGTKIKNKDPRVFQDGMYVIGRG
ncbi:50S ribosomal protein L6 [Methanonatronarchaeum sp. AMET-Sl]|uniref:50S ribosomal protein L6 n=1 Tax=Methanonatronarchaeum sp. AMET-Sl TaxID=3037654 RepID=UPI00244E20CD|nr:50S ribosomal protein L6 [Methanonatronarchaeum sp. AMET-Sl]WGI17219.1 50S ribosomal protein L6 [Methanonatronarchaeum sp. AMET-Sl]